ncbi:hypothetical protein CHH64_15565 [Terribacillus saccharophilus]|uniref:Uncharacterized protein n=1 Tax=Terribacillus saccharophilus TaxID=361277 RepID=A0A268A7Q4_9BACI|nr:hypothetical protein CHH64_15565 [Terribacillus saccharophilus]
MINKQFLKFNLRYFLSDSRNLYLYLAAGSILLGAYGILLFIIHSTYTYIPKPFHVVTYNIDKYYMWTYWFLVPFTVISFSASKLHRIPENILVRINSFRRILYLYYIQISCFGLWATGLIGIITLACFPLASKPITFFDTMHVCLFLLFCYMNFVNFGLLLIILNKNFNEQISFLLVILLMFCDQYLFGHTILEVTSLLYIPVFSLNHILSALFVNVFIMLCFMVLISIQIQKRDG